jgi:hypothetical protein
MKERILILQSIEDQITARREMRIKSSPLLKEYEIESIYAVELTDKQRQLSPPMVMEEVMEQSLSADHLFDRLKRKVGDFKPSILLVHIGFVFHQFSDEMLFALKSLKHEFPDVRIGLESRGIPFVERSDLQSVFDTSAKTIDLIEQVF